LQSVRKQQHDDLSDRNYNKEIIIQPQVKFVNCPIRTSLGILGKKWTILIIRDSGVRKINRFNRILESIPGFTPRVLSMRLKELEKEGLIECIEKKKSPVPMMVLWRLTDKGKDTLPILMQMLPSHPNGMLMLSLRIRSPEDVVRYFHNLKQER
jgi:DNA-binding HxlR family transcriptional regulator